MKSILISAVTLIVTASLTINAYASENPNEVNDRLRDKVVKLIDHPDLSALKGQKFIAEIEFIVTRRDEIIVLAVYAFDPYFDEYIKDQLNYKKINLKGVQRLTPYRLNVNFVRP